MRVNAFLRSSAYHCITFTKLRLQNFIRCFFIAYGVNSLGNLKKLSDLEVLDLEEDTQKQKLIEARNFWLEQKVSSVRFLYL